MTGIENRNFLAAPRVYFATSLTSMRKVLVHNRKQSMI